MTGTITSLPPVIEQPPGNNSSNPAGLPGITYTTAVLTYPQTWTALQTFPAGNISLHSSDIIGTIPTGLMPAPTATTLGGVNSIAAAAHNWITSIDTSGLPHLSQPSFSDISGSVAASQLPNPGASTLGGIQSAAGSAHQWINSISTSGVPGFSQPGFADVSGSLASAQMPALTGDVTTAAGSVATSIAANAVTNAKLATMAAWTFKANNTGTSAVPTDITIDGLTAKGSPAAGDELIIWDVAGTALKKATVGSIGSAAGVSSVGGQTGAITVSHGLQMSSNDLQMINGQLAATATNDNASAGNLGEILESTAATSTLSSGVTTNCTSLTLTAGDWELFGEFFGSGTGSPSVTQVIMGISTTSATYVNNVAQTFYLRGLTMTDAILGCTVGPVRVSLSASQTWYAVTNITYSGGTFATTGRLHARRVR